MRKGFKNNAFTNIGDNFDDARSDYDATKSSRFVRKRTGLAPQGGTADYHFRSEPQFYTLLENMRDLDRNDGVCGPTITKSVESAVQSGFVLSPTTGDKDTDLELYLAWQEFANDPDNCDIAGEMNWNDYEQMALRSVIVDGDCVVLGTKSGQLQFIEAHSVVTKNKHVNTFLGVTMDAYRKRSKYWISLDPIEPGKGKETAVPVDVRDKSGNRQLFHAYIRERSSATRGVGALARIFPTTGMVDDIRFAKLVQQQIVSCFAIIRTRQIASNSSGLPMLGQTTASSYGEESTETSATGDTRLVDGVQPGMEISGKDGETIAGFSPNVPNSEFFQHVWLELSIIGANLGMPVCQMLMDFTHENFVGFRGADAEARKGFRRNQRNLKARLHTPVYKWKVRQWIESGKNRTLAAKFKAGVIDPFSHDWRPPSWPYLEPVNDAAGDLLRARNGLAARRTISAERGEDWETVSDHSIEDNAYAIIGAKKMAAKINSDFPDDRDVVSWRDVINLPTADGIQVALQPNKQDTPASATASAKPSQGAK